MLRPITQCGLTDAGEFNAIMVLDWCALDTESGAFLRASGGRTSRAPKYFLILPNRTVEQRGGLLAPYDWDYPQGRKIVRAWSLEEAIDLANKKLERMLKS